MELLTRPRVAGPGRGPRPSTNAWGRRLGFMALALATPGCAFVLDFETLHSRETAPNATDAGIGQRPGTGAGGQASTGPEDAGSRPQHCSVSGCDDGDPCTTDTCSADGCIHTEMQCTSDDPCRPANCMAGACVTQTLDGQVVLDGIDQVIPAQELHATSSVAAGGRFLSASYGLFDGSGDVHLTGFGTDSATATTKRLGTGLPSHLALSSPASIASDERGPLEFSVYAAVEEQGGATDDADWVIRIRMGSDLEPKSTEVPYLTDEPTFRSERAELGPSAQTGVDGEPYVVWPGVNGSNAPGIYVQKGDNYIRKDAPGPHFIPLTSSPIQVQALDGDSVPGAVWMLAGAEGTALGATTLGADPVVLNQCSLDSGVGNVSLEASRIRDNLWGVNWSEGGPENATNESTVLVCSESGCTDRGAVDESPGMCSQQAREDRVREGVEHLALASFVRQTGGALYQAVAVTSRPAGELGSTASVETQLALLVNPVLPGDESHDADQKIRGAVLASGLGPYSPTRPTVAVLDSEHLAVTWFQRSAETEQPELHVQRHRICFGADPSSAQ